MVTIHEEVELEDFKFDEVSSTFTYPCPCGDLFSITWDDLQRGIDIATCPSCPLNIRVIYDMEQLIEI